jgi:hypothetical protein
MLDFSALSRHCKLARVGWKKPYLSREWEQFGNIFRAMIAGRLTRDSPSLSILKGLIDCSVQTDDPTLLTALLISVSRKREKEPSIQWGEGKIFFIPPFG